MQSQYYALPDTLISCSQQPWDKIRKLCKELSLYVKYVKKPEPSVGHTNTRWIVAIIITDAIVVAPGIIIFFFLLLLSGFGSLSWKFPPHPLPWRRRPREPLKPLNPPFAPSPLSVTRRPTHTLYPFPAPGPRRAPGPRATPAPELRPPASLRLAPRGPPRPPAPHLRCPAWLLWVQRAGGGNRAHLPAAAARVETRAPSAAGVTIPKRARRRRKRALPRPSPRQQRGRRLKGSPNTSTNYNVATLFGSEFKQTILKMIGQLQQCSR